MEVLLGMQWGAIGAFVAMILKYCDTRERLNANPWELVADPRTGKMRVDRKNKEAIRYRRRGYFIIVALIGVVGAAVAACAVVSGLSSEPFMAIGLGATAPNALSIWKKTAVLKFSIRSVLGRSAGGPDAKAAGEQ